MNGKTRIFYVFVVIIMELDSRREQSKNEKKYLKKEWLRTNVHKQKYQDVILYYYHTALILCIVLVTSLYFS